MKELRDYILHLKQEIEAGLLTPPTSIRALEAESVTLTLGLTFESGEGGAPRWCPLAMPTTATAAHSLTINFRIQRAEQSIPGAGLEVSATSVSPLPSSPLPSRAELIANRCVSILGNPGFDNSARAEVFSELVAEFSRTEVQAALASVMGTPRNGLLDPPDRLIQRLRRILNFSPAGHIAAAQALQRLFEEYPVAEVLAVIAERWRFGTHWNIPKGDSDSGGESAG